MTGSSASVVARPAARFQCSTNRSPSIWNDTRIQLLNGLRDRKPLLKGRCATCQWLPVCNGNFRARAEAATGDYWQSDPGCYLLDSEVISGAPE